MRVHIPLAGGLDASRWRARFDRGEVPDSTPYGLHHLEDSGIRPRFGMARQGRGIRRLEGAVSYRVDGFELVETLGDLPSRTTRSTDAVLCYDERTGIPSSLLAASSRRFAPVVTGIGWITDKGGAYPRFARLVESALARTPGVWTQCRPVLTALQNQWGVPSSRLHFVPLGIDTDFYGLQPAATEPGLVVSAGEDRFRDHDLLTTAMNIVQSKRPESRLELATSLPVDVPASLGVVHTERMDGRMRDLYRRSSLVAVALRPTISGSGLTVVLEAMASGRPVVVTDNPGMDDYVEHGVTGLLVPAGDTEAFAAAIEELLADPDRAAEMGSAAAVRARTRFTSAVMASHVARILREV